MTKSSKWRELPTEAINPASRAIDTLPIDDIIEVMILDQRNVLEAVRREKDRIASAVAMLAEALADEGRLIFVGAGTSGRLGVLEAAEMPPTFGISRDVVRAVIAGGMQAVHRAKENVEDDAREGAAAIRRIRPTRKDAVIGVSASGTTPFVRGALTAAKKAGSRLIAVTCVPESELGELAEVVISLAVGPEVIAGSTRLKAGTATKVVLNMLTTAAMVRTGKTYGNLMVDVRGSSAKLRDRARRILSTLTGLYEEESKALLRRAKGNLKAAIVMQKCGVKLPGAIARLREAKGSVRQALGE